MAFGFANEPTKTEREEEMPTHAMEEVHEEFVPKSNRIEMIRYAVYVSEHLSKHFVSFWVVDYSLKALRTRYIIIEFKLLRIEL